MGSAKVDGTPSTYAMWHGKATRHPKGNPFSLRVVNLINKTNISDGVGRLPGDKNGPLRGWMSTPSHLVQKRGESHSWGCLT